jgi:hypothetical protein
MAQWSNRLTLGLLALLGVASLMVGLLARFGLPAPRGSRPLTPSRVAEHFLESEQMHARELDRVWLEVRARYLAKQEAARLLLAGRCTLAEAVTRFRQINTSALIDAGVMSEEGLCRELLHHAATVLHNQGQGHAEATRALLEAKVAEHLKEREGARRGRN